MIVGGIAEAGNQTEKEHDLLGLKPACSPALELLPL